jgi:DNA mismatch repair ATPase MutS
MQANLLQPLADPATLEMRLDAVGELLAEAQLCADVQVTCGSRCTLL